MNKRVEKRHKRQVARAKERLKLSAPDVRTPEQVAAAREASRAVNVISKDPHANYSTQLSSHSGATATGAEKADAES
jgi:hypothetical protein